MNDKIIALKLSGNGELLKWLTSKVGGNEANLRPYILYLINDAHDRDTATADEVKNG